MKPFTVDKSSGDVYKRQPLPFAGEKARQCFLCLRVRKDGSAPAAGAGGWGALPSFRTRKHRKHCLAFSPEMCIRDRKGSVQRRATRSGTQQKAPVGQKRRPVHGVFIAQRHPGKALSLIHIFFLPMIPFCISFCLLTGYWLMPFTGHQHDLSYES